MGVSIRDWVETYKAVMEVFEEDKECEHSVHKTHTNCHGGKAEWYGEFRCPSCGDTPGLKAYCAPWKAYVDTDISVVCGDCGFSGPAQSVFYQRRWHKI